MTETIKHPTQKKWLRCLLDKGMFSDEIAVTYPSTGNLRKSVFVPQTEVEGSPGSSGRVQVLIMRRNNKVFALLPSPQQELVEVMQVDIME